MAQMRRAWTAGILWLASWSLMLSSSFMHIETMAEWGLFTALLACVASGWWIVRRERVQVERLVDTLADELIKLREVRHLPER